MFQLIPMMIILWLLFYPGSVTYEDSITGAEVVYEIEVEENTYGNEHTIGEFWYYWQEAA